MDTIGDRLEAERLRRGMSQDEAAARLNVTQATFSRWVKGTAPKPTYWPAIARFVGITRADVAREVTARRMSDSDRLDRIEREIADLRRLVQDALGANGKLR